MREVKIVLGLIKQGEHYLLQHRNGDAKIGAAGLIGCFGGKIDTDELPHKAVSREISEETTLQSDPDTWELLGELRVQSDHQLEPVQVHATVFQHVVDETANVLAKEGELVRLTREAIIRRLEELTPATRALFEEILIEDN